MIEDEKTSNLRYNNFNILVDKMNEITKGVDLIFLEFDSFDIKTYLKGIILAYNIVIDLGRQLRDTAEGICLGEGSEKSIDDFIEDVLSVYKGDRDGLYKHVTHLITNTDSLNINKLKKGIKHNEQIQH